jgi:hypothetical protein
MYKITEIQDVSRPRAKRFLAHVTVHTTNKDTIKKIIQEATEIAKHTNTPSSKFKDELAHAVWLYVHYSGKLICRTLWVTDKKTVLMDEDTEPYFLEIRLPKPLEYDELVDNIQIEWKK